MILKLSRANMHRATGTGDGTEMGNDGATTHHAAGGRRDRRAGRARSRSGTAGIDAGNDARWSGRRLLVWALVGTGVLGVAALVAWATIWRGGSPDPLAPGTGHLAGVADIGVLVFREGLECILVLAAVTATMTGPRASHRQPVAVGAGVAFGATLATWFLVVGVVEQLLESVPALQVQAATGLLAIVVLLVVMNWFFHKVYWTGWIRMHNDRKKRLMEEADSGGARGHLLVGLVLLGFTSLYREGFEVVLFLQSYRLRLGGVPVLEGVILGLAGASVVAVLTFVANRRLPYRKMLVFTGVMLGGVLLVMVGEQAQEMQLAGWLTTTKIQALDGMPAWLGLWFAVFPTVETLAAQGLAALLVLGSYFLSRFRTVRSSRKATTGAARVTSAASGSAPRGSASALADA